MKLFGISFGKKSDDDDDDWDDDDEDDEVDDDDEDQNAGAAGDDDAEDDAEVEDAAPDDDDGDISEDDFVDDDDDDDWDDEDDDDESGDAGKLRLIAIGSGALVLLAAAGGGAWWFLGGDAPPQPSARAMSEGPRVVMDVPPKGRASGGGLLSPPAGTALTPGAPNQNQMATQGPAPAGGGATLGGSAAQIGAVAGAAPGSLNAVSSSIREPGAGIVVPAVTQVAFAAIPAAVAGQPLAAVPDPALIEQTDQGSLPKIGEDGRMAWQVYARPFEDKGQRPRIVVIISGLGLSRAATEAAVGRLPGEVTLAFDPYAKGLQDWVSLARQAGHEVLLMLPMETAAFPLYDPGPLALLTTLAPEANLGRLTFLLSRISGYVGVVSAHGSKFTAEKGHFLPVLEFLKNRGLMYVDNGSTKQSLAPAIASEIGLPSTISNVNLDFNLSRSAIDSRLATLEETARKNKTAVVMASPYPVVIERLAAWIGTLDKKGLVVAPVSSLPVPTAAPPATAKPAKP